MLIAVIRTGENQNRGLIAYLKEKLHADSLLDAVELEDIKVNYVSSAAHKYAIRSVDSGLISRIVALGLQWSRPKLRAANPDESENLLRFCEVESRAAAVGALLSGGVDVFNAGALHPKYANANSEVSWWHSLAAVGWSVQSRKWDGTGGKMHSIVQEDDDVPQHDFMLTVTERSYVASPGRRLDAPANVGLVNLISRTQELLRSRQFGWLNIYITFKRGVAELRFASQQFSPDTPTMHFDEVLKEFLGS